MLFDTFTQIDRLGRELNSLMSGAWSSMPTVSAPVNIYRDGERYVVETDLPGMDPGSIDITVEDDTLTIKAERSTETTSEEKEWLVRERTESSVVRRFTLGGGIDPDAIEATYRDGVLSVSVPLAADFKRHKIPVEIGSADRPALSGGGSVSDEDTQGSTSEGKADAAHSAGS